MDSTYTDSIKKKSGKNSKLLGDSNFRWLLTGFFCSMIGDQFTLIALPWLVLKLTGNSLALGMVLAAVGIPRALFILIGGAIVDRYSPKRVIIISNYINAGLLILLAVLVMRGSIELWVLYLISAALGTSTAFAIPAANSITPQVVKESQLQMANSMIMMTRQLTLFAGPLLSGIFITVFANNSFAAVPDATGIGVVFFLDAITFLISILTLHFVVICRTNIVVDSNDRIFDSVLKGIKAIWIDMELRIVLFFITLIGVFIAGPMLVALPVIADTALDSGAVGYGALVAAYGVGVLAGMFVSGLKPNFGMRYLGINIVIFMMVLSLLIFALILIKNISMGFLLLFTIGALVGFVQVGIYTWVQNRVSQDMMGRTMSILMFCYIGLVPLTAAISGWIIEYFSLAVLFVGAGGMLFLIATLSAASSSVRAIGIDDI